MQLQHVDEAKWHQTWHNLLLCSACQQQGTPGSRRPPPPQRAGTAPRLPLLAAAGWLSCDSICFIGRNAADSPVYWHEFWARRGIQFDGSYGECGASCRQVDRPTALETGAVTCAQFCADEQSGTAKWGKAFCRDATEWDSQCPQPECQANCLAYFRTGVHRQGSAAHKASEPDPLPVSR